MTRVLVTGSSTFFAARLIQQFGRRGVRVTAADSLAVSAGKASRFVDRTLRLPRLGSDPGGYLDALLCELRTERYDLLVPTFEESLLLAEYRAEVGRWTDVSLPEFETALAVHCKPLLHHLCAEWGLASPPTLWPADGSEVAEAGRTLGFPLLLKLPMANNSVGRALCRDADELQTKYQTLVDSRLAGREERPFLQQPIDGDLVCTLMYCRNGRKFGELVYRNLRTVPDGGGTSAHRESIEHPEISRLTARFAAATDWNGFAGLDFLVERESGVPYLIDVNPRANPAVNLGFVAGVDWTDLLLALHAGEEPEFRAAAPGFRTRTKLMDVAWLLEGLAPGPGWWARSRDRLRRYRNPGWTLDAPSDLIGREDWRATLALTWQCLAATARIVLTQADRGRAILDDANYSAPAAARLAGRSLDDLRAPRVLAFPTAEQPFAERRAA